MAAATTCTKNLLFIAYADQVVRKAYEKQRYETGYEKQEFCVELVDIERVEVESVSDVAYS